jgi:hypothetical protein
MSRTSAIRDAWHPQTRQEREAVLLELQQVLASSHFCNSKRYPALLQYIVEKTLAGESDSLKERTLGIEVFDRPVSYDTNADTVVRYTAGEVRKRLSLYYHELDRRPAIQISLPAGSYIPEFVDCREDLEAGGEAEILHGTLVAGAANMPHGSEANPLWHARDELSLAGQVASSPFAVHEHRRAHARRIWRVVLGLAGLIAIGGVAWRYTAAHPKTPLESFWAPVLHDQQGITVCLGGSVFSQTHLSGVATATKDVDYPFISMQSAAAVAQISALLERSGGVTTQLESAAATPLTDLRDHPVILLGGYNNQWTLRFLGPLRFHFSPVTSAEAIADATDPERHWQRDPSMPYSNADDYAVVARFRDATTGSWVIVLAGLGRNGTEAAAQFATSEHYMQLLRDQAGTDLATRNVEAVLKVSVIDGKTGAPSIVAVQVW